MASRPGVTRHFVLALFEYLSIWSVVCNTSTEHDMWSIAARNVVNLYEFFCGGRLTLFALRVYWVYIEYTWRRKCKTIGSYTSCLSYLLIWWTCLVVTEHSFMFCSMKLIDQLYSITKYRSSVTCYWSRVIDHVSRGIDHVSTPGLEYLD